MPNPRPARFALLLLPFVLGCLPDRGQSPPVEAPPAGAARAPELTPGEARQAIIAKLEEHWGTDHEGHALPALRAGEGLVLLEPNADGLRAGHWSCDLEKKRFLYIDPPRPCQYSCSGTFELVQGKWALCMESETFACRKGPDIPDDR